MRTHVYEKLCVHSFPSEILHQFVFILSKAWVPPVTFPQNSLQMRWNPPNIQLPGALQQVLETTQTSKS